MSSTGANANAGRVLKRANPGTIHDKLLVGYQGWFTCANDGPPIGEGHHGWLHWINQPLPPPANGRPNTDLWPDTSAYEPSELYPVDGLALRDGTPAKLFSSRDPRTVGRHFRWMAEHGVDGVFLQRFVGQVDPDDPGNQDETYGGTRRLRDEVGKRVREAAEKEGRVWAIMYDVSGVPASSVARIIARDYAHLVHQERIFDSPAYLRERGRPVVAVWGFGLSDSGVSPHVARAVFAALRAGTPRAVFIDPSDGSAHTATDAAQEGLYIFAGVPSHWRNPGQGDAHADPAWAALWLGATGSNDKADQGAGMVDALSPWSVGRYSTAAEVERWGEERWGPDAELVGRHNAGIDARNAGNNASDGGRKERRVDYVPVVLPGGSGFNLSEGKWAFNGIKRDGGKFLWSQILAAKKLMGVRSLYGAMWDEYDEGTAFLPVVEKKRLLPQSDKWPFLALDEDGYDLPADWYMRIAGFAAEGLRGERRINDTLPSKELQDYWATRPRYEGDASHPSSSAAGGSSASTAGGGGYTAGSMSNEKDLTPEELESERKIREAQAQFEAWSEEQRRAEEERGSMPPPAYTLEDEGPAVDPALASSAEPAAQAPPVQQQPIQQQPPQQQQPIQQQNVQPQQQTMHHQQPPQHPAQHGADAAVGALAGDFARQRIGASPPPLHPAQAVRRESDMSAGGGHAQEYGRPPLHPALSGSGPGRTASHDSVAGYAGSAGGGAGGSFGGRVGSPEVQGQGYGPQQQRPAQGGYQQQQQPPQQGYQPGGSAVAGGAAGGYQQQLQPPQGGYPQQQQQQGYQQAQHTGGSAGSSSSSGYPQRPQWQQQNSSASLGSAASYAPQGPQHGPQPQQQYAQSYDPHRQQQQQHTGGSGSSAGAASSPYPAQAGPQYPAQGGAQYQRPQSYEGRPPSQQQHAGPAVSGAAYPPSTYPGQAPAAGPGLGYSASLTARPASARPASTYPGQESAAYASGSGLAHSASLSARPPPAMYSPPQGPSPRPDSAPRPTTGYASYPGHAPGGGAGYPASPPPHGGPPPAHLAPRPESVRPTTPGYPGQAARPPMGPPQQSSYPNQYPSNGPPASYPGSSYNPPGPSLPSPDIPGPAFPPGPSQYGGAPYRPPPQGHPAPQSYFPTPQQGPYGPPPPGSPSYPPTSPAFPQGGSDNAYPYQQPAPQHFPGPGYSPQPQPYAGQQQPQGPWVPGGAPPPMPHRASSRSLTLIWNVCVFRFRAYLRVSVAYRTGKYTAAGLWTAGAIRWSQLPHRDRGGGIFGSIWVLDGLDGQDCWEAHEGAA
ncbi:hypothetical protein C8R43DRAFT_342963 [Mycena crocata]|nr:hypothetical protein C8R43DRAFT_342963 [Mycena crocata]